MGSLKKQVKELKVFSEFMNPKTEVIKKEKEATVVEQHKCGDQLEDEYRFLLDKTEKQKVEVDKLKEKLLREEEKIDDRKKEIKHEKETGEGSAFKDEPGVSRDTIRQKDSVVDQL